MAYQIDFTAANYANRSRRKWALRLLLLGTVVGSAWGIYDAWQTYNLPTLNMRLTEYEAAARPVEDVGAAWEKMAKEYNATMRYYRLVGGANPTNFLDAMAAPGSPRLGRGFLPRAWTLTTGGACTLDYRYVFNPGDKAEQAKRLEGQVVSAVTSAVAVVDGKVELAGVQVENLLNVHELSLSAKFALSNVVSTLDKKGMFAGPVSEIAALRKLVQETKLRDAGDDKGMPTTAQGIMRDYLPKQLARDGRTNQDRPDFPALTNAVSMSSWFERADQFIARYRVPADEKRAQLKAAWNKVGEARLPWQRFRALDNDDLVQRTKSLKKVSEDIKPFKGVLDQYHAYCTAKLGAFVDAYERQDVFNKPLVASDLKDRVARAVGVVRARVAFKDEPGGDSVAYEKGGEAYAFSWVRWTLALGDGVGGRDVERAKQPDADAAAEAEEPLTLARVADCVRKTLTLGPGYVLETVKVGFGEDGNVAGAVLEGLLPVKKVEPRKEAQHVD